MSKPKLPGRIVGPHSFERKGAFFALEYFADNQAGPQGHLADKAGVEKAVAKAMTGRWATAHSVHFLDDGYYLPTLDEVKRIFALSRVSRFDYVDQRFDCDDFALGVRGEFSLYGYEHDIVRLPFAFGIIMGSFTGIGSNHAMCLFVDDTETVYLIEPRRLQEKAGATKARAPSEIKVVSTDISQNCYLLLI